MQQLHYTYDPVGNITEIYDEASEPVFFKNQQVEPRSRYAYDALYRLVEATGRESFRPVRRAHTERAGAASGHLPSHRPNPAQLHSALHLRRRGQHQAHAAHGRPGQLAPALPLRSGQQPSPPYLGGRR
ncbi:MAG: hypothetical protein WKF84_19085 [Pyrinomonadaceae bacterium]